MTTAGVWIDQGPCWSLQISASPEALGNAIHAALAASSIGIAHPTSWSDLNAALLEASGVESWSVFGKSAKCVNVDAAECISVEPTRNEGSRGGFVALEERIERVPLGGGDADLGNSVKRALDVAE